MAPKNIDETIKKLLEDYAKWCATILGKQAKEIQNRYFHVADDRTEANQEYTKAKNSLAFLEKIAKDPKKYLYSGNDLIYSKLSDGQSIYDKLEPLMGMPFDRTGKFLLVRLGEQIAYHVNYGSDYNNVWVYYGKSGMSDSAAESIIMMSKTVELWNNNAFKAALKDIFLPMSAFAIDFSNKSK